MGVDNSVGWSELESGKIYGLRPRNDYTKAVYVYSPYYLTRKPGRCFGKGSICINTEVEILKVIRGNGDTVTYTQERPELYVCMCELIELDTLTRLLITADTNEKYEP